MAVFRPRLTEINLILLPSILQIVITACTPQKLLLNMNQVRNKICFGSCYGNYSKAFECIASKHHIINHSLSLQKPLDPFCSCKSLLLTLQLLRIKKNWWGFEMMDV